MQFRSPTGEPIRVCLLSGHAALIGPEWRDLPEIFHREALAQGAQCDATRIENVTVTVQAGEGAQVPATNEDDDYRNAIILMLERKQPGDFVASTGLPNLKSLQKVVGFNVDKEKAYAVFHELTAEAATDDNASSGEGEEE